ncbi:MAG: hypothetical protein KDJ52_36850, partial [Anaerolineae bacterium]|nr:hypothetical protein [Anaerolineae bacterium]
YNEKGVACQESDFRYNEKGVARQESGFGYSQSGHEKTGLHFCYRKLRNCLKKFTKRYSFRWKNWTSWRLAITKVDMKKWNSAFVIENLGTV